MVVFYPRPGGLSKAEEAAGPAAAAAAPVLKITILKI